MTTYEDKSSELKIALCNGVSFVVASWKKVTLAASAGALVGYLGWFAFGSYSAEFTLINNSISSNYGLDLVSWKSLQKSLPSLATQMVDEQKVPKDRRVVFEALASNLWWQKNVKPGFAFTRSDLKEFGAPGRDFDPKGTSILSFTLTMAGSSRPDAIKNVRAAADFMRSGGAYLDLINLINAYELEVISLQSETQKQITSTEIEMDFQLQRAKNLEELYRRFPGGPAVYQSINDPKDSGAKYLSISTQIIAINNDINQSKENLQRYRDRIEQIGIIKFFLEKAKPIVGQTFDGILLSHQLLEIEQGIRADLAFKGIKNQEVLDSIRSKIVLVQARFTKGLDANTAPVSVGKKGLVLSILVGIVAMLCCMFLVLYGKQIWVIYKAKSVR